MLKQVQHDKSKTRLLRAARNDIFNNSKHSPCSLTYFMLKLCVSGKERKQQKGNQVLQDQSQYSSRNASGNWFNWRKLWSNK